MSLTQEQLRAAIATLPVFRREATLARRSSAAGSASRAEGADEGDELEIALSSEAEVERTSWFGERWIEILDHSAEAVDLRYGTEGLPLLVEHDRWTGHGQVGLIEGLRIDTDKVLRGTMRFSRGMRGQEVLGDVKDGIRKNASIGYRILEAVLDRQDKEHNVDYYRITRWMPVEGSIVAIPADITVGVGRSGDGAPMPPPMVPPVAPKAKERTMEELETRGAAPGGAAVATPPAVATDARGGGREIAQRISELATTHGFAERIPELLRDHSEVRTAAETILGWVHGRAKTPPTPAPIVDLSAKDARRFSMTRMIAYGLEQRGERLGKHDFTFERELEEAIAKRTPVEFERHQGGIMVPTRLRRPSDQELETRAGLDSATATKGAELKFTQPGEFIEALTARMRLKQLGARVLSGLTGPVTFPKQTGRATHTWMAENPGADAAESELTLGTVALAIKTLIGSTYYSRQLLVSALSSSVDAQALVEEDLVIGAALALDLAGIQGTGASNQPRGITQTSGIGSVAIGTDGGAPTWDHLVNLEGAVAAANADIGVMGFLTTPGMRSKLRRTQIFSGTNGQPIWTGGQEGDVLGYRALSTTQVPSTLTKGVNSDCHAIIHGVFDQCLFGEWGAMEMIVDPFSRKRRGMIDVTCFLMADFTIRHPAALAAILDARNI